MLVDIGALRHNADVVGGMTRGGKLCAMIKAEAYGHGLIAAARALRDKVDCFGVATAEEALAIKDAGIAERDTLIVGRADEYYADDLLKRRAVFSAFDGDFIRRISARARALKLKARAHIKIDSGMRRLGVDNGAELKKLLTLCASRDVAVEGIFTHYATSDCDAEYLEYQYRRFNELLSEAAAVIGARAFSRLTLHGACSGALLRGEKYRMDMARTGLLLYGYSPAPAPETAPLKPVMTVGAKVLRVQRRERGDRIGYGGRPLERDALLAVIGIGYGDGYKRGAGDRAFVSVRGALCPVVGVVCMDMTTADVTGAPSVRVGDTAFVIGGGVTADDLAARCGTIAYDVMSSFTGRVKRRYINENNFG